MFRVDRVEREWATSDKENAEKKERGELHMHIPL